MKKDRGVITVIVDGEKYKGEISNCSAGYFFNSYIHLNDKIFGDREPEDFVKQIVGYTPGNGNFPECKTEEDVEKVLEALESGSISGEPLAPKLNLGQMVELRNGGRYILIRVNHRDVLVDKTGHLRMDQYTDNLLMKDRDRSWDIMKIYNPEGYSLDNMFDTPNLIWERTETVELTLDQIAKKFKIPVNQLKIKK